MNMNKPVTKIIQAIKTSNGTFKAISIFVQIMTNIALKIWEILLKSVSDTWFLTEAQTDFKIGNK